MTQTELQEMEAHRERVRTKVAEYLKSKHSECGITHLYGVESSRNHIIEIGTSILCTKWKIGYEGGGFVKAILSNNLMESFGRADNVNQQCILFYVKMLYNMDYVE